MLVGIATIKCFIGNIGENYPKSPEPTVNEVMEIIIPNENYPASEEPISNGMLSISYFRAHIGLGTLICFWFLPNWPWFP